jgi:ribosome modulation factor
MNGITAKDVEILGWALATVTASTKAPPQLESLLDMLDRQYSARMAGLEAGLGGHMQGENPFMCSACKNQWQAGWAEGQERRAFIASRCGPVTVVLR